jgi:hypothetical protein
MPLLSRDRTRLRFLDDRNVYDPATAHTVIEYIHTNAVERGLVARPEDWAWSSARGWAGSNDLRAN